MSSFDIHQNFPKVNYYTRTPNIADFNSPYRFISSTDKERLLTEYRQMRNKPVVLEEQPFDPILWDVL